MSKKPLVFLVILLILLLSGCGEFSSTSAGKIIPPSIQANPLEGKWVVRQESDTYEYRSETAQSWVHSNIQFAADAVAFGGHVWDNPSYKMKRVNAFDYLMTKSSTLSDTFALEAKEVDIITVYAESNYLGELMKIGDKRLVFYVQNKELLLERVSDQADSPLGPADTDTKEFNREENKGPSGILLGLRRPSDTGYDYRTLWVAADDQLHPVLAAEQLYFPRTSGFWELQAQDTSCVEKIGNILTARNVVVKSFETNMEKVETKDQITANSAVGIGNYIGNDFVVLEKETAGMATLQVQPVDKLGLSTAIKIQDLLGGEGLDAYISAREHAIAELENKGVTWIDRDTTGENVGLIRKNGHWYLIGRVNYRNGEAFKHKDFDIKAIPPKNLVFYDTLVVSWHKIKNRVPDALDAFTSPDKNIALVKTKNKLIIYTIHEEQLAQTPLAEIDLQEEADIIMAEWAVGSYVESWEKSFLSYGAKPLPESVIRTR